MDVGRKWKLCFHAVIVNDLGTKASMSIIIIITIIFIIIIFIIQIPAANGTGVSVTMTTTDATIPGDASYVEKFIR